MDARGADEHSSNGREDQKEVTTQVGLRLHLDKHYHEHFVHHNLPRGNTRQEITSPSWEYNVEEA